MATCTSILCLVGASTTTEMVELSELYARGCMDALGGAFDFAVLHWSPDGTWRFAETLAATQDAPPLTFAQAVTAVSERRFDIGLPQMFCHAGMTAGRALFELLSLPFIGNTPLAMGLTADKAMARSVVADAGVRVPEGRTVTADDLAGPLENLPPLPVIVKPVASDNSEGLSLVRDANDLRPAMARAFAHGDALVERFIPAGRELRCGVIEWNGEPLCLPPEEYPVDADQHPIRTRTDKLARAGGVLTLAAKSSDAAWIIDADDPVTPALHTAALKAYHALGCRHYGLFDFRVDEAGEVWFLEAGLYCSFSPQSVVAVMADAAGITLPDLLSGLIDRTLNLPTASAA